MAEDLEAMCAAIQHRGPDDTGVLTDREFGFGMTRLAIVDLAHGNQPIFNRERTVGVVCNGEIYNSPALRKELETRGYQFSTRSDVEPIIYLYQEYGVDFVRHLRGMFALAVWDVRERRLVLARDRLGIKPLHFFVQDGTLGFASEIKSILQIPGCPREIDPSSLDAYLSLSYIPGPRTIYRDIQKLPPGTTLIADRDGIRTERFWQLRFPEIGERRRVSQHQRVAELQELLRETVESHLLSDVPLGVFLSGGVDSSLVLALMTQIVRSVKTFSITFAESSYSEGSFAREVADCFGTDHQELVVEPDHATAIPDLVSYLDEPFGDLSAVPVYFLSKFAREQVKVVLSGDGGDEVFAGYMTYVADRLARYYRRVPAVVRKGIIARVVRRLPTSYEKVSFDYKAKRFVEMAERSPLRRHLGWKEIFTPEDKRMLYGPDYRESVDLEDPFESFTSRYEEDQNLEFIDRMLSLDTATYLADDILTKVDRMSMAHSLEVRVPLLDHRVVEYAAGLSPRLKLKGLRTKHILKEACRDLLPRQIVDRKKAGFIFPASLWLQKQLREFSADVLSESRLKKLGIFNYEYVQRMLQEHWSGRRDRGRPIWNLLVFAAWHSKYMERAAVPSREVG